MDTCEFYFMNEPLNDFSTEMGKKTFAHNLHKQFFSLLGEEVCVFYNYLPN